MTVRWFFQYKPCAYLRKLSLIKILHSLYRMYRITWSIASRIYKYYGETRQLTSICFWHHIPHKMGLCECCPGSHYLSCLSSYFRWIAKILAKVSPFSWTPLPRLNNLYPTFLWKYEDIKKNNGFQDSSHRGLGEPQANLITSGAERDKLFPYSGITPFILYILLLDFSNLFSEDTFKMYIY